MDRLTHGRKILFYGYLAAVFVSSGIAIKAIIDVGNVAQSANRALCAQRDAAQSRVNASREFLRDHPHGIPGIPAALILRGIRRDQESVHGYRDVTCPAPGPPKVGG